MKKTLSALIYALLGYIAFLICAKVLLSFICDYEIQITLPWVIALIPILLLAVFSVLFFTYDEQPSNATVTLSGVSAILYVFSAIFSLSMPLIACCFFVSSAILFTFVIKKSMGTIKYAISTVYTLLTVAFVLCAFLMFFASIFPQGTNEVIKKTESPDGKYYFEIIADDQGALGGNTQIYVRKNKDINTFFFTAKKKGEKLYQGKWMEQFDIVIHWKNGNTVIINDKEYNIQNN